MMSGDMPGHARTCQDMPRHAKTVPGHFRDHVKMVVAEEGCLNVKMVVAEGRMPECQDGGGRGKDA